MGAKIQDGTGTGNLAQVNSDNELHVLAVTQSEQHWASLKTSEAYQTWGTATLSSGTVNVLYLENESLTRDIIITFIRMQVLGSGGATLPDSGNYFEIVRNTDYTSGGSAADNICVNFGSTSDSDSDAYDSGPTLDTAQAEVLERWYPKDHGDMMSFSKMGAIVIPSDKSILVRYIGDQTGGIAYARFSYYFDDPDE